MIVWTTKCGPDYHTLPDSWVEVSMFSKIGRKFSKNENENLPVKIVEFLVTIVIMIEYRFVFFVVVFDIFLSNTSQQNIFHSIGFFKIRIETISVQPKFFFSFLFGLSTCYPRVSSLLLHNVYLWRF